jgi:hypothetical protein
MIWAAHFWTVIMMALVTVTVGRCAHTARGLGVRRGSDCCLDRDYPLEVELKCASNLFLP